MVLNAKQAAEHLQCGIKHIRWLLETGRVKGGKIANQWRTTPEALDEFVLSGGEPITKFALERQQRHRPGRPRKAAGERKQVS